MVAFASVCAIISPQLMTAFSLSEEATKIGVLNLRFQCICMPLLPLNFMAGLTYQSVGNKAIAAVLSASRQGIFYIPAVLILPKLLGLLGVQTCQAISDFFAFFFALPFTFLFFSTLKKEEAKCAAIESEIGEEKIEVPNE